MTLIRNKDARTDVLLNHQLTFSQVCQTLLAGLEITSREDFLQIQLSLIYDAFDLVDSCDGMK